MVKEQFGHKVKEGGGHKKGKAWPRDEAGTLEEREGRTSPNMVFQIEAPWPLISCTFCVHLPPEKLENI